MYAVLTRKCLYVRLCVGAGACLWVCVRTCIIPTEPTRIPDVTCNKQTFIISTPPRYKSGDGLLNKLLEAQMFIQQAVAENSALRNYVHLLRAMHTWRLFLGGASRKKVLLKRIVLNWGKGLLSRTMFQWLAAFQVFFFVWWL